VEREVVQEEEREVVQEEVLEVVQEEVLEVVQEEEREEELEEELVEVPVRLDAQDPEVLRDRWPEPGRYEERSD
jgi:hypothetical protein